MARAKPSKPKRPAPKGKPAPKPSPKPKAKAKDKPQPKARPARAKPIDALAYTLAAVRTVLGEGMDGVTVTKTDTGLELALGGQPYAAVTVDDDLLEISLQAPIGRAAQAQNVYTPDRARPGWIHTRIPVTRDPRPWLGADVGSLVGATMWEVRHGRWHNTLSAGGPYVVVPANLAALWDARARKKLLVRVPDDVVVHDFDTGQVLLLGAPDPLYWWPTPSGGVLARVVSFDADDEAVLRAHLAAIPDDVLRPTGATFDVSHPALLAFDAQLAGVEIRRGPALGFGLSPGRYAVASGTYAPDAGTELLLVGLAR